jgi:hypothetical protein
MKPGLSRKFRKPWDGPYRITARRPERNYEILNRNRYQVVHINRLKPAHGYFARETRPSARRKRQPRKHSDTREWDSDVDVGMVIMARGFLLAPDNLASN